MICNGCVAAADSGNTHHGVAACDKPETCPCQHGFNLECDPEVGEGHFGGYLDALPPDDPRRIAYEKRVGRQIARDPEADERLRADLAAVREAEQEALRRA